MGIVSDLPGSALMNVERALFLSRQPQSATFAQVCHLCGHPVCAIPQADVAKSWNEPVMFSYIAQKQHERDAHGAPGLE